MSFKTNLLVSSLKKNLSWIFRSLSETCKWTQLVETPSIDLFTLGQGALCERCLLVQCFYKVDQKISKIWVGLKAIFECDLLYFVLGQDAKCAIRLKRQYRVLENAADLWNMGQGLNLLTITFYGPIKNREEVVKLSATNLLFYPCDRLLERHKENYGALKMQIRCYKSMLKWVVKLQWSENYIRYIRAGWSKDRSIGRKINSWYIEVIAGWFRCLRTLLAQCLAILA